MRKANGRLNFALLVPALLFLIVFLVIPIGMLLVISFQNQNMMMQPTDGITFDRYIQLFTKPAYIRDILTSLGVAFVTTAITLVVAYPAAYLMANVKSKSVHTLLYIILISPLLTSVVVRSFAWVVILSNNGLLNELLEFFGLIDQPISMLWSLQSVIIAYVQVMLPLAVLPIATSLEAIPDNVKRASTALGAGRVRTFFKVVLPLTIPGAVNGGVIVFALAAGSYITPKLIGGVQPLLPLEIYSQALLLYDLRMAAAMSIVLLVIVFIIILPIERLLKHWEVKVYG